MAQICRLTVLISALTCIASRAFPPCSYGSHFLLKVVSSSTVHCPGLLAPVAPPAKTAASLDDGCPLTPLAAAGSRSMRERCRFEVGAVHLCHFIVFSHHFIQSLVWQKQRYLPLADQWRASPPHFEASETQFWVARRKLKFAALCSFR